jgi:hypothetical protein
VFISTRDEFDGGHMEIHGANNRFKPDSIQYCEDCRVLTEALRDMEQQCREAEDERFREIRLRGDADAVGREEERYIAKLSKLERRRDSALEVLLKHQRLEHAEGP